MLPQLQLLSNSLRSQTSESLGTAWSSCTQVHRRGPCPNQLPKMRIQCASFFFNTNLITSAEALHENHPYCLADGPSAAASQRPSAFVAKAAQTARRSTPARCDAPSVNIVPSSMPRHAGGNLQASCARDVVKQALAKRSRLCG